MAMMTCALIGNSSIHPWFSSGARWAMNWSPLGHIALWAVEFSWDPPEFTVAVGVLTASKSEWDMVSSAVSTGPRFSSPSSCLRYVLVVAALPATFAGRPRGTVKPRPASGIGRNWHPKSDYEVDNVDHVDYTLIMLMMLILEIKPLAFAFHDWNNYEAVRRGWSCWFTHLRRSTSASRQVQHSNVRRNWWLPRTGGAIINQILKYKG